MKKQNVSERVWGSGIFVLHYADHAATAAFQQAATMLLADVREQGR
ncbi:MAG TPA: hypothetical protein VM537_05865 [Anaerolineae bacterium]|nr:hypothetical protein [Anaerolineae bacterium]